MGEPEPLRGIPEGERLPAVQPMPETEDRAQLLGQVRDRAGERLALDHGERLGRRVVLSGPRLGVVLLDGDRDGAPLALEETREGLADEAAHPRRELAPSRGVVGRDRVQGSEEPLADQVVELDARAGPACRQPYHEPAVPLDEGADGVPVALLGAVDQLGIARGGHASRAPLRPPRGRPPPSGRGSAGGL